jgi:hypothetical protein
MITDAQVKAARHLVGHRVRFAHEAWHPGYLVLMAIPNAMIEIEGFTGVFAPHLVVRVDQASVEELGPDRESRRDGWGLVAAAR